MKYVAVILCAIALLTGCAGASNSGGDTTCADFLAKRPDDMDATVARMLKERNGRNSSTMDVVNTRLKVLAACAGKPDVTIGDLA